MLVGGAPTRCTDHVPRPCAPTRSGAKMFRTIYFLFENQSMVDFQKRNQSACGAWKGRSTGFFLQVFSSQKGSFWKTVMLQKFRCNACGALF